MFRIYISGVSSWNFHLMFGCSDRALHSLVQSVRTNANIVRYLQERMTIYLQVVL
jgi:hypothetical protein